MNVVLLKLWVIKGVVDLQIVDVLIVFVLLMIGCVVCVDFVEGQELVVLVWCSKYDVILVMVEIIVCVEIGVLINFGCVVWFFFVDFLFVLVMFVQFVVGILLCDYLGIMIKGEWIFGFVWFDSDVLVVMGIVQGIVKCIVLLILFVWFDIEVIGLKVGDMVVGVVEVLDDVEFVFVIIDVQLLYFLVFVVCLQGVFVGGMVGMKFGFGVFVFYFGVVDLGLDVVVVMVFGVESIFFGIDFGCVKVLFFIEYLGKG